MWSRSHAVVAVALLLCEVAGFAPRAPLRQHTRSVPFCSTSRCATPVLLDTVAASSVVEHIGSSVAFADQAGKLAGTFFQASLLPYVAFLYFLGYEKNNCPRQAYFGFQFLLLFVLSTVFTGIVTKSVYSSSLADVDWLHGGAETLLTTTNLYVASGFRNAMAGEKPPEGPSFRYPAFAIFALVVLATAAGPTLGFEQHSAFLSGLGNLDANPLDGLLGVAMEPANALSIPTWAIHFSSVFEWIFAMGMVNQYAKATGNDKWRYLTYGMLPLHASGVAACTYHFFYNSPDVGFLVTLQAGLTLLGNTTVAIAALLIALSNGWTFQQALKDANPFDKSAAEELEAEAAEAEGAAAMALTPQDVPSTPLIAAELVLLTLVASYAMKYGETALGVAFDPNAIVGWLICITIPAAVGYRFASLPTRA